MNKELLDFAIWLDDNGYLNKAKIYLTRSEVEPVDVADVLAEYARYNVQRIKDERRID